MLSTFFQDFGEALKSQILGNLRKTILRLSSSTFHFQNSVFFREDIRLLEADTLGKPFRPKSSASHCNYPKYSNSRSNSRQSFNTDTARKVYSSMAAITTPTPRSQGRPNSGRLVERQVNPDTIVRRPRKGNKTGVAEQKQPVSASGRTTSRTTFTTGSSLSIASLEDS